MDPDTFSYAATGQSEDDDLAAAQLHAGMMPPQQFGGAPAPGYGYPGVPTPYYSSAGATPPAYGYGQQQSAQFNAPAHNQAFEQLTGQMADMGIHGEMAAGSVAARAHKKRHRHAHHDIGSASAAQMHEFDPMGVVGGSQPGSRPTTPFAVPTPSSFVPAGPQVSYSGHFDTNAVHTHGKVDPEQIPSVPRMRDTAALYYRQNVYPTMELHVPPPAAVPYVAHDQGNSSPKFARLTVNTIPATSDALASIGLPLGMVLQPLAPQDGGEQQVPVVDFGEAGPPRCRRCRTYINPFMTFKSGGNKFSCNMCTFPNEVAPEYFSPLEPSGVRVDRLQRPELMVGTCEFNVPKQYWDKQPVGLRWLFLIDVCQEAVNRGILGACCEGIKSALYGEETAINEEGEEVPVRALPEGAKVGIMTYDTEVHFYNLSPRLDQAQMMVMPDLEDPFVPLSEGLFVDPYESEHVITELLDKIPNIFRRIKRPEPALLPAINAAFSALEQTGGKIVCSLSCLPTWGPGHLFMRDTGHARAPDAERRVLSTEHAGWKKTATRMADCGVGVDFFVACGGGVYMDLATIGHASAVSGGEMFYYPNFRAPRDVLKLSSEIAHSVRRETGYHATMKIRCSNGLQVAAYHGNFLHHVFGTDLELGSIDADKAISAVFTYDGKLDSKLDAHFQAALLYTTAGGQRQVRCINIVAAVSEGGMETMKSIDHDAVLNVLAKDAAMKIPDKLPRDARGILMEKMVEIYADYRKNFSLSHPPGQLVLPESLKEFSMYILALIKCRAFKGGHEPSDRRLHDLRMIRSFGCRELSLYLYPRIIPIHNLNPEDCFANEEGQLQVPPSIRASFSQIDEGGVYVVDNGQMCILWLHAQVSPNLLVDLFGDGITSLDQLDPNLSSLPVLETLLNAQVRNLLQYLVTVRGSKSVTVQLARQGLDGAEFDFARLLVEDRNNEAQSYVDWLVALHRMIQVNLSGQRKKEDRISSIW